MICVTYTDGYGSRIKALVAPVSISRIHQLNRDTYGRQSTVVFTDGKTLDVYESMDELQRMIDGEKP